MWMLEQYRTSRQFRRLAENVGAIGWAVLGTRLARNTAAAAAAAT